MVNVKADSKAIFNQVLDHNVWYKNGRRAGETIFYEFNTNDYDYNNIRSFKIILESLNGDADLFVSTSTRSPDRSNKEFSSQLDIRFDQVEIERKYEETLNATFYVGV